MKLTLDVLKSLFTSSKLDGNGENLICPCPRCGKSEFGIAIKLENHPCNCYRKKACGWEGNIYSLLKEIGRIDLLKYNKDYSSIVKNVKLENLIEELEKEEIIIDIPNVNPPIGFKRIESHPYLDEREFIFYDKYEVGVTRLDPKLKNDYVIFLIRQFNEIKGYTGRHTWSKDKIEKNNKKFKETGEGKFIMRYYNSPQTDFANLIFGYDEITENTKLILLVEGFFDKFRVDKLLNLHKQEEIICCATFKCHLSDVQKKLFKDKGIDNLILMYDYDVTKQIIQNINNIRFDFESILVGVHPSKDPGDFNEEDIDYVFENLVSTSTFLSKNLPIISLRE